MRINPTLLYHTCHHATMPQLKRISFSWLKKNTKVQKYRKAATLNKRTKPYTIHIPQNQITDKNEVSCFRISLTGASRDLGTPCTMTIVEVLKLLCFLSGVWEHECLHIFLKGIYDNMHCNIFLGTLLHCLFACVA